MITVISITKHQGKIIKQNKMKTLTPPVYKQTEAHLEFIIPARQNDISSTVKRVKNTHNTFPSCSYYNIIDKKKSSSQTLPKYEHQSHFRLSDSVIIDIEPTSLVSNNLTISNAESIEHKTHSSLSYIAMRAAKNIASNACCKFLFSFGGGPGGGAVNILLDSLKSLENKDSSTLDVLKEVSNAIKSNLMNFKAAEYATLTNVVDLLDLNDSLSQGWNSASEPKSVFDKVQTTIAQMQKVLDNDYIKTIVGDASLLTFRHSLSHAENLALLSNSIIRAYQLSSYQEGGNNLLNDPVVNVAFDRYVSPYIGELLDVFRDAFDKAKLLELFGYLTSSVHSTSDKLNILLRSLSNEETLHKISPYLQPEVKQAIKEIQTVKAAFECFPTTGSNVEVLKWLAESVLSNDELKSSDIGKAMITQCKSILGSETLICNELSTTINGVVTLFNQRLSGWEKAKQIGGMINMAPVTYAVQKIIQCTAHGMAASKVMDVGHLLAQAFHTINHIPKKLSWGQTLKYVLSELYSPTLTVVMVRAKDREAIKHLLTMLERVPSDNLSWQSMMNWAITGMKTNPYTRDYFDYAQYLNLGVTWQLYSAWQTGDVSQARKALVNLSEALGHLPTYQTPAPKMLLSILPELPDLYDLFSLEILDVPFDNSPFNWVSNMVAKAAQSQNPKVVAYRHRLESKIENYLAEQMIQAVDSIDYTFGLGVTAQPLVPEPATDWEENEPIELTTPLGWDFGRTQHKVGAAVLALSSILPWTLPARRRKVKRENPSPSLQQEMQALSSNSEKAEDSIKLPGHTIINIEGSDPHLLTNNTIRSTQRSAAKISAESIDNAIEVGRNPVNEKILDTVKIAYSIAAAAGASAWLWVINSYSFPQNRVDTEAKSLVCIIEGEHPKVVYDSSVEERVKRILIGFTPEQLETLLETYSNGDPDSINLDEQPSYSRAKRSASNLSDKYIQARAQFQKHTLNRLKKRSNNKEMTSAYLMRRLQNCKKRQLTLDALKKKGLSIPDRKIEIVKYKEECLRKALTVVLSGKKFQDVAAIFTDDSEESQVSLDSQQSKSNHRLQLILGEYLTHWETTLKSPSRLKELLEQIAITRADLVSELFRLTMVQSKPSKEALRVTSIRNLHDLIAMILRLEQLVNLMPRLEESMANGFLMTNDPIRDEINGLFHTVAKRWNHVALNKLPIEVSISELETLLNKVRTVAERLNNYFDTDAAAIFSARLRDLRNKEATPLYFTKASLYQNIIEELTSKLENDDEAIRNQARNRIESLTINLFKVRPSQEKNLNNSVVELFAVSRVHNIKSANNGLNAYLFDGIDIDKFLLSELICSRINHNGKEIIDTILLLDYLCQNPAATEKGFRVFWPKEIESVLASFLETEVETIARFNTFIAGQDDIEVLRKALMNKLESPKRYFQTALDKLSNGTDITLSSEITYRYRFKDSLNPEINGLGRHLSPPQIKTFTIVDILVGQKRQWESNNYNYDQPSVVFSPGINDQLRKEIENADVQNDYIQMLIGLESDQAARASFLKYANDAIDLHHLPKHDCYSIDEAPMLIIYPTNGDSSRFSRKIAERLNPDHEGVLVFSLLTNQVHEFTSINDFKQQIKNNVLIKNWVSLHFPVNFDGNFNTMKIKRETAYLGNYEEAIKKYIRDMDTLVKSPSEMTAMEIFNRLEDISYVLALPAIVMGSVSGFLYGAVMSVGPLLAKAAISDTEDEQNAYLQQAAIAAAVDIGFEGAGELIGKVAKNYFKIKASRNTRSQSLELPPEVFNSRYSRFNDDIANGVLETSNCSRFKRGLQTPKLCKLIRRPTTSSADNNIRQEAESVVHSGLNHREAPTAFVNRVDTQISEAMSSPTEANFIWVTDINTARLTPVDGKYSPNEGALAWFVHSDGTNLLVKGLHATPAQLAPNIKSLPGYNTRAGEPLILASCTCGQGGHQSIAQQLADQLGRPVVASPGLVHIDMNVQRTKVTSIYSEKPFVRFEPIPAYPGQ